MARKPGTKTDVLIYGRESEYTSGARIFRTDRELVVNFTVQDLERLRAAKEHPHYGPVGVLKWAVSRDGGFTWQIHDQCPTVGKVLDATSKSGPLANGGVVTLAYTPQGQGWAVIQQGCVGYHGYLKSNPPLSHRYDLTDLGPFTTFYNHNITRVSSGALIAAGYSVFTSPDAPRKRHTVAFLRSADEGRSWHYLSHIVNNHWFDFSEPDIIEVTPNRLLVVMRVDLPPEGERPVPIVGYGHYLYQAESADLGQTWSEPAELPLWGHPPNLTLLKSGNILLAYGHRRPPYSVRAILSRDQGRTWDMNTLRTLRIFEPGGRDIGYPVATQLDDGSVFCAYYGHLGVDLQEKSAHGVFASIFDEAWLMTG